MEQSSDSDIFAAIHRDQAHFARAPHEFFEIWKRGVTLAGVHFFGDGTREGFERAASKWDLPPRMPLIRRAFGPMSPSERKFLAAMTSFYNSRDSRSLLQRAGFEGFSDLDSLDLDRRQVIASLILTYVGW
ncbi:hypothetical protein DIE11_17555 [Burkholderia sp. Bp9012]|uniref:hypothetical protein n=1 Tax=Burkholderia sp. Bp9012 TaxID=2184562 RepID=UPI000F5A4EF6|nr:hypothetical protein [Burkholderia sp. Bp9012]RQR79198.1 hypothetical protein DIE11_17555 [Burkholderia sp. Bp9012]